MKWRDKAKRTGTISEKLHKNLQNALNKSEKERTTKENEYFTSPKDRMVIELAVNHIESIFRDLN